MPSSPAFPNTIPNTLGYVTQVGEAPYTSAEQNKVSLLSPLCPVVQDDITSETKKALFGWLIVLSADVKTGFS